jgi:hypothetical protein
VQTCEFADLLDRQQTPPKLIVDVVVVERRCSVGGQARYGLL